MDHEATALWSINARLGKLLEVSGVSEEEMPGTDMGPLGTEWVLDCVGSVQNEIEAQEKAADPEGYFESDGYYPM